MAFSFWNFLLVIVMIHILKYHLKKRKKNQKYFYYIGRSFLFHNTRTKLSTIIVGAVIKTITILLLVNIVANVKNCGWIISKILTKRTKEIIFFGVAKVRIVAVGEKLHYLISLRDLSS